jgi:3-deoxy-7-phosphoheptulonate synthase
MIIQLQPEIRDQDLEGLQAQIQKLGLAQTTVRTQAGHYLVAVVQKEFDIRVIGHLPGVKDVHRVSDAYKLVSHKWKVHPTRIDLGDDIVISQGELSLMAGPCSIENDDEVRAVAAFLAQQGVRIMRGGAFKPRTSPYSFRGLGIEGLKSFYQIAREHGLRVISEVLEISQIEEMYPYIDIYQVGTRNTQNFSLLHELGRVDKPVLIKRGMSGTLDELLQSAEYVFSNGNEKLILCERGIRTFERSYRNTLDLNAVPVLKEKSHLPVIVDPSHGVGVRRFVDALGLAAIMAGADGLLLEIHQCPEKATSDGAQTLNFAEAAALFGGARASFDLRRKLQRG